MAPGRVISSPFSTPHPSLEPFDTGFTADSRLFGFRGALRVVRSVMADIIAAQIKGIESAVGMKKGCCYSQSVCSNIYAIRLELFAVDILAQTHTSTKAAVQGLHKRKRRSAAESSRCTRIQGEIRVNTIYRLSQRAIAEDLKHSIAGAVGAASVELGEPLRSIPPPSNRAADPPAGDDLLRDETTRMEP